MGIFNNNIEFVTVYGTKWYCKWDQRSLAWPDHFSSHGAYQLDLI